MKVTYLFHSGFLVETAGCYYLFDYWKGALPPLSADKPVIVFASHSHADHYNPEIFSLLCSAGMRKLTAVLAKDIRERSYPPETDSVDIVKAYHDREYLLSPDTRVRTLLSTDSGVAYLVTCPEGVLYHAGDLNDWSAPGMPEQEQRQMRGSYRAAVNKLKGKTVDIAFLPLDPRLGEHYADGFAYFLKNVKVKAAYPMHCWEQPQITQKFMRDYPQFAETVQVSEAFSFRA